MELAPLSFKTGTKVPFLFIGNNIGSRKVCESGHSEMSGDYVIEEVHGDGNIVYRRLVFLSNQNVVQSEAKLKTGSHKKKGKGRQATLVVDKSYLACQHHVAVVAGLACVQCDDFPSLLGSSMSVLLVGLGGGGLPTYIHSCYPDGKTETTFLWYNMDGTSNIQIELDVVDMDLEIVTIATEWFGFVPDNKLRAHVAEGLVYIQTERDKGSKRHVVMLNVDSKDITVGMSCPPQPFVEQKFLQCIKDSLYNGGVFILNLVCKDETLKTDVKQRIQSVFGKVFCHQIEDEVNDIVYALNIDNGHSECYLMKTFGENSQYLNRCAKKGNEKSEIDLIKEIESLKIL